MRQCVYCKVYNTTTSGVSFHRFPKDESILNLWLQNMDYDLKWRPLKNHYLCSQHFSSEFYNGKRLKKGSVPTKFESRIFKIKIEFIKEEVEDKTDSSEAFEVKNKEGSLSNCVDKNREDETRNREEHEDYEINIKKEVDSSKEINSSSTYVNSECAISSEDNEEFKIESEKIDASKYSISTKFKDINLVEDNSKEISRIYEKFKIKNEEVELSDGECANNSKVENISDSEVVHETNLGCEDVKRRGKGRENDGSMSGGAGPQRECDTTHYLDLHSSGEGIQCGSAAQLLKNTHKKSKKPANIYKTSTKPTKRILKQRIKNENECKPKLTLFICDHCAKHYKRKNAIMEHMKKHTLNDKDYHSCPRCSYKTVHKALLSRHVRGKHTDKTFKCPHCDYTAKYSSSVSAHVNVKHTKNNIFKCSVCSYTAFRKVHLQVHINCKHSKSTFHACPHCAFKTHFKSALYKHINSKHTKTNTFNCPNCTFTSLQRDTLTRHINSRHKRSSFFICDYCDYKAYVKNVLALHINAKHTKNTSYKCPFCEFKTFGRTSIDKHVRFKHERKTEYVCPHCDYKTFNKSCFGRHLTTLHAKTDNKSKHFHCPHCSYGTPRNSDLSQHINAVHSKTVSFSCSLCNFITYYKQKLNRHMRRDHSLS